MTQPEIYEALWEHFIVFERGLDPERAVALDSCIDAASRKLATRIDQFGAVKPEHSVLRSPTVAKED